MCFDVKVSKFSIFILITILWFESGLLAQSPEKAREEVYQVLIGQRSFNSEKALQHLKEDAWEALSYIEEETATTANSLLEAVPDYYNFQEKKATVKLIDSKTYEYGLEVTIPYQLTPEMTIQLVDQNTGVIKDEWQIIYVDQNYLALDMGDLRVFFVHTKVQE